MHTQNIDKVLILFQGLRVARLFKLVILALVAALSGGAVTAAFHLGVAPPKVGAADLSYADFLAITLTALALMITVLGFFVAAAGVVGWTTLESKLRDHSVTYFKDQLSKDGELRAELEELFADIAYEGVEEYRKNSNENGSSDEVAPEGDGEETDYRD